MRRRRACVGYSIDIMIQRAKICKTQRLEMDVSLILKIAGVGVLISVAVTILNKSGRDEQAMLVTVAGIIAALMLLISQISELFDMIVSAFGM